MSESPWLFPRELSVDISNVDLHRRFIVESLFARLLDVEFDTERCRHAVGSWIADFEIPQNLIRPDWHSDGGLIVTDATFFPSSPDWTFTVFGKAQFPLSASQLPMMGEAIRGVGRHEAFNEFRERCAFLDPQILDLLTPPPEESAKRWMHPQTPGIYRREHASLLVRSRTTSIVVDPIGLSTQYPHVAEVPLDSGAPIDAVCITHSHEDHWHLPSILYAAANGTVPIIVPAVPRENLLCGVDMGKASSAVGQAAIVQPWWTTTKIGDIEVDILPFYGEQPSRCPPGPPNHVRSWGNCYRFNTEEFSVLVLADSGADPDGDMRDVVAASVKRRGPLDVVISCMRTFSAPFFGGLANYGLALPLRQLQELYRQFKEGTLPPVTAGPETLAEICRVAQAQYFMPYAHGLQGLGVPVSHIGWDVDEEPSEAEVVLSFLEASARAGSSTVALEWNPGDAYIRGQKCFKRLKWGTH